MVMRLRQVLVQDFSKLALTDKIILRVPLENLEHVYQIVTLLGQNVISCLFVDPGQRLLCIFGL